MAQRSGDGLNFAQRARMWLARKALGRSFTLSDPQLATLFQGGATYAGKNVDATSAMQIAAVWSCVRILSETIGSLPWGIFQRDGGGNAVPAEDHPLSDVLIRSPNGDMTSTEFRESLVLNLALQGNAYSLKELSGRRVASLYPIPATHVIPKREEDGEIAYKVHDRGRWEPVPREKIWHVKGFGSDGVMGYSPISYARQALGVSMAAEEFQARFFGQGARPSMMFKTPDGMWLDPDQRAPTRESLQRMVGGLENAHRVALLEGGITPVPLTMPLGDAQFLELRGFSVQEICRIFRIPPHMVADLERSTNNNIEHQGLEFVMFTLQPYLTRIEDSAAKWLLPVGERRSHFLRFNVEGLLRAVAVARAQLYATLLQNGAIQRNEVRGREGLNRVEGLDVFTVQSNMVPVDMIVAMVAAQIEKSKQPAAPAPAPVKESGGVEFNVALPESMKHAVHHDISQFTRDLVDVMTKSFSEAQRDLAADIASSHEDIKSLLRRDRIAEFDDDGKTVRSRLAPH